MVISSAKPEDSGRYECVAESTSGHRASLAAQLLVAHDTRIPETSEYPPSLFLSSLSQPLFIYLFIFRSILCFIFSRNPENLNKKSVCEREKDIYLLFIIIIHIYR